MEGHNSAYHAGPLLAAETSVHRCASGVRQSPAAAAAEMCHCKDAAQHPRDWTLSDQIRQLILVVCEVCRLHDSANGRLT